MSLYLTPRQVAERWSCSTRHVQKLCASGELRAMRLGLEAWRIPLEAVEAYEAAHTSGSVSSPSHEAPKAEPIRPACGVLPETGAALVLPARWWETTTNDSAAPSAAGRGRSTGKKKAVSQRH